MQYADDDPPLVPPLPQYQSPQQTAPVKSKNKIYFIILFLIIISTIIGIVWFTRSDTVESEAVESDALESDALVNQPICENNEFSHLPTEYRGEMNVSVSGRECMNWLSQEPHQHGISSDKPMYVNKGLGDHNFCRNPDDEPEGAWCYTMDPDVRWEYCSCEPNEYEKIPPPTSGIIEFGYYGGQADLVWEVESGCDQVQISSTRFDTEAGSDIVIIDNTPEMA
jgi:hypothetical protein